MRSRPAILTAATVAAVAATAAVPALTGMAAPAVPSQPADRFYTPPADNDAYRHVMQLMKRRAYRDAAGVLAMIRTPHAVWYGDQTPAVVERQVRATTRRAARQHKVPVLALYDVPGRDCGSYSAGGVRSTTEYRAWIDAVARGIGDREALVILEPDSLALLPQDCPGGGPDGDAAADPGTGTDPGADHDPDHDAQADPDHDGGRDQDTDPDAEPDPDAGADPDAGLDDPDTDPEVDPDADLDPDAAAPDTAYPSGPGKEAPVDPDDLVNDAYDAFPWSGAQDRPSAERGYAGRADRALDGDAPEADGLAPDGLAPDGLAPGGAGEAADALEGPVPRSGSPGGPARSSGSADAGPADARPALPGSAGAPPATADAAEARTGSGGAPPVPSPPRSKASPFAAKPADQRTAARFGEINYAVATLEPLRRTRVYLDAGHSAWHTVPSIVTRLLAAGVERATGFYLNASNYQSGAATTWYGRLISSCLAYAARGKDPASCPTQRWRRARARAWMDSRLGAVDPSRMKHFVTDTSRNGRGPWKPRPDRHPDPQDWCNPPGRGLGARPTTRTGHPLHDAMLWVKTPGESDGLCLRGTAGPRDPERGTVNPRAGKWFAAQAIELVRRAQPAIRPVWVGMEGARGLFPAAPLSPEEPATYDRGKDGYPNRPGPRETPGGVRPRSSSSPRSEVHP